MLRCIMNKKQASLDKEFASKPQKFPKDWPSPDHHKCSRFICKYPNGPKSVSGTYTCWGCHKGTYFVTHEQASKIHDDADRTFRWLNEKRKEGEKKRMERERIGEELAIARYLAEDEEQWCRAWELNQLEQKQHEEQQRMDAIKAAEEKWRAEREVKKDSVMKTVQTCTAVANEAKIAKVERRAAINSTMVHVEAVETGSVSSASMYSQPSYVSSHRSNNKPLPILPSKPTPPVPPLPQSQRRPLTPDSSHTVSSQESYRRPRVRVHLDTWDTKASSSESDQTLTVPSISAPSPKRSHRNTITTSTPQISAAHYYTSQSSAKHLSLPRSGVPVTPKGVRYQY